MSHDPDEDRIRSKAHELWEGEGRPHGRHTDHWEQAREIIALQDSLKSTLLPRDSGASEPVESMELQSSYGDVPSLTDQGEHDLTAVSREPESLSPAPVAAAGGDVKGMAVAAAAIAPKPAVAAGKALPSADKGAPAPRVATAVRTDSPKASRSGPVKTK